MKVRKNLLFGTLAFAVSMSLAAGLSGITAEAAEKAEHTLFFASDYQGDPPAEHLSAITKVLEEEAIAPELAVWCGDYTNGAGWIDAQDAYDEIDKNIKNIKTVMSDIWPGMKYLMLQGNHDNTSLIKNGILDPTGPVEYDDYIVYTINKDDYPWVQGVDDEFTTAAKSKQTVEKTASDLEKYLDQLIKEEDNRPVLIATHIPLHWSSRSTNWSSDWSDNIYSPILFDVINEAGKELDILFLFGHNHSGVFDQYIGGSINYLTHGDVMRLPDGTSGTDNYKCEVLNFTYLNAGYMGYTNVALNPSVSCATILTIGNDEILVEKYSPDGIYEPATKRIELNGDRDVNPQILSRKAKEGIRLEGESEVFDFSEGSVDVLSYRWSCDDKNVAFRSDTDERSVTVEYLGETTDAMLKCHVSGLDAQGNKIEIERTYSVSLNNVPDKKNLELSAKKSDTDTSLTYSWNKKVYIDSSKVYFEEDVQNNIKIPSSYKLEYKDENGKWRVVPGSKCTEVRSGLNSLAPDGFYTDGLRLVFVPQNGTKTAVAEWKLSGDDKNVDLLADFDFDHAGSGFKGGVAVATGQYTLDNGALYLDGSSTNWLNVTKGDGSALLEGKKAITVSFDVKRGNTGANWAFYTAPHSYEQRIKSEHYMGILVNGGLYAESYYSYGLDRPTQAGLTSINGEWMHVDVVYTSSYTEIYINGRLASHRAVNVNTSKMFTKDSIVWIGKAAWGKGEFFEGWLDNYQIYGRAFTPEEIAKRQNVGDLKVEFDFDEKNTGFYDDNCVATGSYSLVTKGNGKAVSFNGINQYISIATAAGNSILSGFEELTVSFDVNPDNTSNTNWAFYAASANTGTQIFAKEKYLGALINDSNKLIVERYNNNGERPAVIEYALTSGWHKITIVFEKDATVLYVDGEQCSHLASAYSLPDILGNNGIIYLGRADWVNGEYYKGQMDNVFITGRALSEDEIAILNGFDKVDKSDLAYAIERAYTDGSVYTEESWQAYTAVLERAKDLLDDTVVFEEELDAMLDEFSDAKKALKKRNATVNVSDVFADVSESDWFYTNTEYVYLNSLMTGMDATHFGPYGQLSRAQFALILYRMEGEPTVDTEKSFGDISGDEWYGTAVLWAAEQGIVTGYMNGNFGPADLITREQMALMMYRYMNYLNADNGVSGNISKFADAASVSGFAVDGMKWAVGNGVITGKENGTKLDPQANAARAECAAIIQRFMQKFV